MQVAPNWKIFESLFARAHPTALAQEGIFQEKKCLHEL